MSTSYQNCIFHFQVPYMNMFFTVHTLLKQRKIDAARKYFELKENFKMQYSSRKLYFVRIISVPRCNMHGLIAECSCKCSGTTT